MFVKKRGSALISTIVILSLMSLLGTLFFKMMKSNRELEILTYTNGDIYNLEKDEEKVLYDFMGKLNKIVKEKNSHVRESDQEFEIINNEDKVEMYNAENLFESDFKEFIGDHIVEYNKEKDKLTLLYSKGYNYFKNREISYKIKDNDIILVPTYKFTNKLNK